MKIEHQPTVVISLSQEEARALYQEINEVYVNLSTSLSTPLLDGIFSWVDDEGLAD